MCGKDPVVGDNQPEDSLSRKSRGPGYDQPLAVMMREHLEKGGNDEWIQHIASMSPSERYHTLNNKH